jgi:HPr kinase/phosphorylase
MAEPSKIRPEVSVARFVEAAAGQMRLSVIAGQDALETHLLDSPRVQKLGLALSGFTHRIHSGRIQIFGNSEAQYFRSLDEEGCRAAVGRLDPAAVSCIVMTAGNEPPRTLKEFASGHGVPLLGTPMASSEAISTIAKVLGYALAPTVTIHGVLLDIFGIGVLLSGESGIGKSECALDLIGRGHRLVSDDAVLMRRIGDRISGEAPAMIRDHLEIRGLGIINARELFGVSVLADQADLGLCIEFVGEDDILETDRLGIDTDSVGILGVNITRYVLPVRPGRNLATLAETAVRVFVSRRSSTSSIDRLIERHERALGTDV